MYRGAAVRSSQAQVHVTNFDYNQYPLNTMPATMPAIRRTQPLRAAAVRPDAMPDQTEDVHDRLTALIRERGQAA